MAIARGAGTELIRTINLLSVNNVSKNVIYGVRHHIYTILSVSCWAESLNAAGDYIQMYLLGYDSKDGVAQQSIFLFRQEMQAAQTFVYTDKFSFMGYEPVDFTGPVDSEAKQDALADQAVSGDSNRQILYVNAEHSSDAVHVIVTYIDQNNA